MGGFYGPPVPVSWLYLTWGHVTRSSRNSCSNDTTALRSLLTTRKRVSGWALVNRKAQQKNYTRIWLNHGEYLRSGGVVFLFFGNYSDHSRFFQVSPCGLLEPLQIGPVPCPVGHWSTGPEKGYVQLPAARHGAHTQETRRMEMLFHPPLHPSIQP